MKKEEINFTGKQMHQGDVQCFEITRIPECWKKVNKTFIAKSEKSGHAHALCGDYEMYQEPTSEGFIIKVGHDGATLNHTGCKNLTEEYWNKNQVLEIADHKPTTFTEGIYYIGIQQRKKHFSSVWEKVRD